jgi:hypothetical protein
MDSDPKHKSLDSIKVRYEESRQQSIQRRMDGWDREQRRREYRYRLFVVFGLMAIILLLVVIRLVTG